MRYKSKFHHDNTVDIVVTEEDIDKYLSRYREMLAKVKQEYTENEDYLEHAYSMERFDYWKESLAG